MKLEEMGRMELLKFATRNALTIDDVLLGKIEVGAKVAVIEEGLVGCETTLKLLILNSTIPKIRREQWHTRTCLSPAESASWR